MGELCSVQCNLSSPPYLFPSHFIHNLIFYKKHETRPQQVWEKPHYTRVVTSWLPHRSRRSRLLHTDHSRLAWLLTPPPGHSQHSAIVELETTDQDAFIALTGGHWGPTWHFPLRQTFNVPPSVSHRLPSMMEGRSRLKIWGFVESRHRRLQGASDLIKRDEWWWDCLN